MKFDSKSVIDIDKESDSAKSVGTDTDFMDEFDKQYIKVKNKHDDHVVKSYIHKAVFGALGVKVEPPESDTGDTNREDPSSREERTNDNEIYVKSEA